VPWAWVRGTRASRCPSSSSWTFSQSHIRAFGVSWPSLEVWQAQAQREGTRAGLIRRGAWLLTGASGAAQGTEGAARDGEGRWASPPAAVTLLAEVSAASEGGRSRRLPWILRSAGPSRPCRTRRQRGPVRCKEQGARGSPLVRARRESLTVTSAGPAPCQMRGGPPAGFDTARCICRAALVTRQELTLPGIAWREKRSST
jgi:hypothetical protein